MQSDIMPTTQAVEALVADYGALVFHVILGLIGDWQESQDLTQDTFVQALRALDAARLASGAHFHAKAWLLQIAVNTARMYRRRRSIMRIVPFSSLHQEEQEETEIESVGARAAPVQPAGYGMHAAPDPADLIAERDVVGRSMARLPETLRLCLLLSIVAGLSAREIARVLDLSEVGARQRLSRARRRFQQLYLEESGEAVVDGSSVTPEASAREQRVTITARSPAALVSA